MSLEYVDSTRVVFHDGTYRWLDAAHFAISGAASDPLTALEALLRHDQYLDHYMTADDVACTAEEAARIARMRADFKAKVARQAPHRFRTLPATEQPQPLRPLHGPYYAEFVTPESFDRLDADTALKLMTAWLAETPGDREHAVPPAGELDGDLAALLATFDAFAYVYRLKSLPETAMHDWGFVVEPYLELIGMDAHRSNLWLVAGGTD